MTHEIEELETIEDIEDRQEKLFNKEVEKLKSLALEESKVARDAFIVWYQDTIAKDIVWTDPATNWIYNAWIASHGTKIWESQESIEKRKRVKAKARETAAKNKTLRAEEEKRHE